VYLLWQKSKHSHRLGEMVDFGGVGKAGVSKQYLPWKGLKRFMNELTLDVHVRLKAVSALEGIETM